jgi:hypothetical protein
MPEAILVTLLMGAYAGIGLIAAALVVSFRTNAAIPQGVLLISTLLGRRGPIRTASVVAGGGVVTADPGFEPSAGGAAKLSAEHYSR